MEDKVLDIFDDLEIEEAERLLNYDVNIDIHKKVKARIRKSVFSKAGIKSKHNYAPRRVLAGAAAAVAILILSLSAVGFDNVKAAISQMFSFIPGVGIYENNESINYILRDMVSTENDEVILTLNNAIASKDSITVMFSLRRKNYSEEQLIKYKQEYEKLQKSNQLKKPNIRLYTKNQEYTEYTGSSGSGEIDTFNYTYKLKPDEINKDTTYKLAYKDYNLSLEFKLKDYQTYNNLEQIGATDCHNDISLTAVPVFHGDQVEVNLYAINKSKYRINSFNKIYYGYKGDDLNLETNSGTKAYSLSDDFNVSQKYVFKVRSNDNNFTLNVPYIIVQSNEDKKISLPIPNADQVINVNKKVKFKDSTMTIVSVKRINKDSNGNDSLMLNIQYENKRSNLSMFSAEFIRINFWGTPQSGGYSSMLDRNDIESTVYYGLEKGDKGTIRLKISQPKYYLTDAYQLKFDRK